MTKYGAILADPPWPFQKFTGNTIPGRGDEPYKPMTWPEIEALPVGDYAGPDCALFCWVTWPTIAKAIPIIEGWGFTYKTLAFIWVKGDQLRLFPEDINATIGQGYWTRSNSEPCLLFTRGRPKRLNADVRQVIVEKRREHSRKPDCQYSSIERLVAGPYLELFSRTTRQGWAVWGNQTGRWIA